MTDLQTEQMNTYQGDNLFIHMSSMDREEVRDLMEAGVSRLNNAILLTTVILSLAGEMLFQAQMPSTGYKVVLNAYMLCLCSACCHLVLAIFFGLVAAVKASETTATLLGERIRPRWDDHFKVLQRRVRTENTAAFEQQPLDAIFRLPLLSRIAPGAPLETEPADAASPVRRYYNTSFALESTVRLGLSKSLDVASPSERSTPCSATSVAQSEWQRSENSWKPLTNCMFKCAAFGTTSLLEACHYLCLGMQYSETYSDPAAWGFCVVHVNFTFLIWLMFWFLIGKLKTWKTHDTFKCRLLQWVFGWTFTGSDAALALFLTAGPFFVLMAVWTSTEVVDKICDPLCYLSHFCANVIFLFMFCEDFTEGDEDASGSPSSGAASPRRASPVGGRLRWMPKFMMVVAMALICFLWLVGFCWTVHYIIVTKNGIELHNDDSIMKSMLPWSGEDGDGVPEVKNVRREIMKPPDDLKVFFRPHSVACPGDYVFLADHAQVYRFKEASSERVEVWKPEPATGSAKSYCDVNAVTEDFAIEDIAADCDGLVCWPVALVNEQSSYAAPHPVMLDCNTGRREALLQAESPAVRVAGGRQKGPLVVAHRASLTEYRYSSRRGAWSPSWDITTDTADIVALDISGDRLLTLHNNKTVVARNLTTGSLCGRWMLPATLEGQPVRVIGGGCAYDDNSRSIRFFEQNNHNAQLMSALLPDLDGQLC